MKTQKRLSLHQIAEGQDGFFTTQQAMSVRYNAKNFHLFVKSGEWIKEQHGLYRLSAFPWSPYQEFWKYYMWSRNRAGKPLGIFSYHTALDLYGITDVLPNEIHITVPKGFHRRLAIPKVIHLHFENLKPNDVFLVHGLPCTNLIKTIIDLIEYGLSDNLIRQALKEALEKGIITAKSLKEIDAKSSTIKKLKELASA